VRSSAHASALWQPSTAEINNAAGSGAANAGRLWFEMPMRVIVFSVVEVVFILQEAGQA
jgi:hypothetical protein